jgi:TonB family protein
MRSTRFAVLCAAAVLAVATAAPAQEVRTTTGPLERAAKPITPENPIPRRTFFIAPAYPAEARSLEAFSSVTLRVTLDQSGRVAEIRRMNNPFVNVAPGAPSDPIALQTAGEAMIRSAAAAVSQWQYDAPASGPISFNVSFGFRPQGETTARQDAGPPSPEFRSNPSALATVLTPDWPAAAGAVRVGGNVRTPQQSRRVNPVYPAEAQGARVQGVVILEAVIGENGTVRDVRVLRSIPLLDQAAIDAVRQWEYTPTHLNGKPVPVVMTVTVQFILPAQADPPPPAPPAA